MNYASHIKFVKNIVVSVTLGVAAVTTWAVTQSTTPTIEAATTQTATGG
jgi:hypothetical protein